MANIYDEIKNDARRLFLKNAAEAAPSMLKYEMAFELGVSFWVGEAAKRTITYKDLATVVLHRPEILSSDPEIGGGPTRTIGGAIKGAITHLITLELQTELRPAVLADDPDIDTIDNEDEDFREGVVRSAPGF